VLGDIEDVAGHTPASVREIAEWAVIVNAAEANGANYCKALNGKTLFVALYGNYTVILHELRALLKASTLEGQTNSPKATEQQTTQEVSKKCGGGSGVPTTKQLELQRKRQCRPKRRPP
jgi:hypothetical protein